MKCPHNERLDYNPDTGVITWVKSNSNRVKNGGVAGYINRQGYRMIQIGKRKVPASHIAWAAVHPDDPILEGEEIDHINHDPTDDRAINLRKTNHRGNCRNRTLRTDSNYGLSGLGWRKKESRWIVQVGPKGAAYRGLFPDLLSAAAEVFRARKELGFHENHGEPKNG